MSSSPSVLWKELESHLPYSVFATAAGIVLAGIMLYVAIVSTSGTAAVEQPGAPAVEALEHDHDGAAGEAHEHEHADFARGSLVMEEASHVTFHVFHPIHMLFSAVATTAMFWRYERKLLKAIVTGLVGALGVCSVSDVMMPYLSGRLLGATHMTFHWCLIQHPMLVVPFALVGVGVGLLCAETVRRSTYFSHSAHVFVSSAASIFYLVSFGVTDWADRLGSVFVLMVIAVTVPCCFSDVVFPLLLTSRDGRAQHTCEHEHHHP